MEIIVGNTPPKFYKSGEIEGIIMSTGENRENVRDEFDPLTKPEANLIIKVYKKLQSLENKKKGNLA